MKTELILSVFACVSLHVCSYAFTRPSEVSVRRVAKLNLDWKVFKGSASGNAFENSYNDDSWENVSIPHSLTYCEPTQSAEENSYKGIAWYRRQLPVSGEANKRYFLEFEGAMQTADVWVNGASVGRHDNSGYTGFSFDITSQLGNASEPACAVKLDNTRNQDIPPGRDGTAPDFYLFSGLYREVWLVTTNEVYIPFCGQLITTPSVSGSNGTVQFSTTVENRTGSSTNCTVAISIRNKSGQEVATGTATETVSAQGTRVFDMSIDVSNPSLWSPENPEFYRTLTTVSAGGSVVDDYAATFGFRTLSWSSGSGFSLNGSRYHIEGVCQHQSIAWVQNAVPDSRWPVEIAKIKDAGYNAIRCSHYPRDPSFYHAADSLGVLLMVEVPTWGYGQSSYTDAFWNRLENCTREMVSQGYNHPSIFLWGLFNEPFANFSSNLTTLHNTVHSLDNTRATLSANNSVLGNEAVTDVVGLNYQTISSYGDPSTGSHKYITTEYFEGWNYYCTRGSDWEGGWSDQGWWAYETANNQPDQHAGQFLWVYNDYTADWNPNKPMGLVDAYRLPKRLYYRFREAFTGKPPDYPVTGTASKIELTADLTNLRADGSDITIVEAALRNNGNACINSTANVTFSVSGPATAFGSLTKAAAAGKVAIVVRATTTAGNITVTANSGGLPQAQISLVSQADMPTPIVDLGVQSSNRPRRRFAIRARGNAVTVNSSDQTADRILAVDIHGRVVGAWRSTSSVNIGSSRLARGVYVVKAEKDGVAAIGKLPNVTD